MQFAGIRSDMDLKQIGDSYNVLVKLNDDVLPSPEALLVAYGLLPGCEGITLLKDRRVKYGKQVKRKYLKNQNPILRKTLQGNLLKPRR